MQALALGAYEPETVDLFQRLVRPGMTVLDVGAHIGYFTLLAARACGQAGHVYAFEPLPSNNALLRRNVAANGYGATVTVCDAAILDREGQVRIVDSGRDGGTATLYGGTGQHIDVPTTTLDSWAEQQGWPRIDLIKMDIEGAEVAALAGMRRVRERNPHLALVIECNPTTLGYAGLEPAALLHALQSCGFNAISIIGARLRQLDLPKEIPFAIKEAHRWDLVNLLCR